MREWNKLYVIQRCQNSETWSRHGKQSEYLLDRESIPAMDIKSGQVGMFIQSFNTPGLNLHLHKAELCDSAPISAPSIGDP